MKSYMAYGAPVASPWTGTEWFTYFVTARGELLISAGLPNDGSRPLQIGAFATDQPTFISALRALARHRRIAAACAPVQRTSKNQAELEALVNHTGTEVDLLDLIVSEGPVAPDGLGSLRSLITKF